MNTPITKYSHLRYSELLSSGQELLNELCSALHKPDVIGISLSLDDAQLIIELFHRLRALEGK